MTDKTHIHVIPRDRTIFERRKALRVSWEEIIHAGLGVLENNSDDLVNALREARDEK